MKKNLATLLEERKRSQSQLDKNEVILIKDP